MNIIIAFKFPVMKSEVICNCIFIRQSTSYCIAGYMCNFYVLVTYKSCGLGAYTYTQCGLIKNRVYVEYIV